MGNSNISPSTFTVEQQILHSEVISVKSSLQVLSGCLSQITQQMKEFKNTLQSLPDTSSPEKSSSVQTNALSAVNVKPPSYAAAVSGNLSDIVKSAVASTIRENKAAERSKTSVAIHNLDNHGNDTNDVRELFDYLECNICVIKVTRIGRVDTSRKPRVLKVELASSFDRNILLRAAKYLKDDLSTKYVYITQWLQPEELAKLKSVKSRCHALNQSSSVKDGKRKYVVINGKIMERNNGSLRPFNEAPASASLSSDNVRQAAEAQTQSTFTHLQATSPAKNVKGGSHVAPS